jgi:hypothetical protein
VPRRFQDDLPAVRIPRLRALGLVTPEMIGFVVRFGDMAQTVDLQHLKFPSGGGWSFFVAPCCGRKARILRLLDGAVICCKCCVRRGMRWRCEPMGVKRRAELSVSRLSAMLESEEPLRLKPSTLWGKMERRSRFEAALRKAEFRVAQSGIVRARARADRVEDPCDEADFKPPKRPWPRLKNR